MSYRRSDCSSLRAAYTELLNLKKRCKLALEEAKRTGNIEPARKLILLCRKKAKELGQQVSPIWEKVDVSYAMRSKKELESIFDRVSTAYEERTSFESIEACKHVSRKPRKIRFEFVEFEFVEMEYNSVSTTEMLAKMEKRGVRPALVEELVSFAERYPREYSQKPIIALGSFITRDKKPFFAVVTQAKGLSVLVTRSKFALWSFDARCLVVRKEDEIASFPNSSTLQTVP